MTNNGTKSFTDILYFDNKENKRVKRKDCEIISDFLLCKNNFFVVEKGGYYFICLSHDGELVSVWNMIGVENGKRISPFEAISVFRRKYMSEKITQERLELFINNPSEYSIRYPKKD